MNEKGTNQAREHRRGMVPAYFLYLAIIILTAVTVLAIALWQNAEGRVKSVLARQLVAQAQNVISSKGASKDLAALLAVQSMSLDPSGDAAQLLQDSSLIVRKTGTESDGFISGYAFSPDGKDVASGSEKGVIRVWKLPTGEALINLPQEVCGIDSHSFSADSKYMASICNDTDGKRGGISRVWEVSTGKEIAHMEYQGYVASTVAISPDGRTAAFATYDGITHVWDVATEKEIAALVHPGVHIIYALSFSPDNQYLATGTREDYGVHIWKVSTQEQIAHFKHDYYVMSIAFSPDGKYVTAGSGDPGHSLRVWEISTQRETAHMAHVYSIDAVAFSPDGRYVISGDEDLTARVWDARSGKELSRIAMTNVNNVISVAFSPDGRVALAGDYYGNLYMWTWQPEDMIAKACARTKRNLTRSEWKMYIGDALPYQAVCRNLPIEGIPTPNRIITPTTYSTATH